VKRKQGRSIGEVFHSARKRQHLSQAEVASRAGLRRSYLSDLERGRRTAPSWDVVMSLLQALDLPPIEFFYLVEGDRCSSSGHARLDPELDFLYAEIQRLPRAQRTMLKRLIRCWLDIVAPAWQRQAILPPGDTGTPTPWT
jgi:transcriptional regulator with XRE-family HTH domain